MFEMSDSQSQAFSAATNGMSATSFCHCVLFLIGVTTTIWLLLIFIGTIKSKKRSLYDSMVEFSIAVCVYVSIGVVIYYT